MLVLSLSGFVDQRENADTYCLVESRIHLARVVLEIVHVNRSGTVRNARRFKVEVTRLTINAAIGDEGDTFITCLRARHALIGS